MENLPKSKAAPTADSPLREPVAGTPQFPISIFRDNLTRSESVWHWHEEFEAGYVTEGAAILDAGSHRMKLRAGDAYFINSNIIHAMRNAAPGEECMLNAFVFHGSIVGGSEGSVFQRKYVLPVMHNARLRAQAFRANGEPGRISTGLSGIWRAMLDEAPGYELYVRSELSSLFLALLTLDDAEAGADSGAELRFEGRTKAMLDFIHSRYAEEISLEEIAGAASVSVSEALRCFKRVTGASPIQYLKKYRLQQAAGLLRSSSAAIGEICGACGFSDGSYFTKSFREAFGCTPRAYRRAAKGEGQAPDTATGR